MSDEETKGDWIAKKLVHHIEEINASRSLSAQQSDVGRRTAHIHCPERAPKLVREHYNLRLHRKRSKLEYEDMHLPAMAIDPIEEAADDLILADSD